MSCGDGEKSCAICFNADGRCIASMRDDFYSPATKEQVERRLKEGRYKDQTRLMERYLEIKDNIEKISDSLKDSLEPYNAGLSPMFYGCSMPPIDPNPTIKMHPCPLCKSENIKISKEYENQGMDGSSADWYIRCNDCGLVKTYLPADDFYGREYYKTKDDAIKKWNEMCSQYDEPQKEHVVLNSPDACGKCGSIARFGDHTYCHMESVSPMNTQRDVSTIFVDPDSKPNWCPIDRINANLEKMLPGDREKVDAIIKGMSFLFGSTSFISYKEEK